MKYQLFKWILVFGIVSTSYSVVCAEESNLIYDGKNYFESNHAIHLFRDRQQIECDEMTVIEVNDDILVAVNEVFPNLGANVEWNALIPSALFSYPGVGSQDSKYSPSA